MNTSHSTDSTEPTRDSQGSMELFLVLLVTVFFPPILLFGFFVVNPREEIVVLRFGNFVTTLTSQGIRWIHPVGRALKRISTRDTTLDIATTTVVERNGNPIQISAVVVYRVEDSYKAALDVEDHNQFIEDQAGAVVKRVSSTFPYESPDDSDKWQIPHRKHHFQKQALQNPMQSVHGKEIRLKRWDGFSGRKASRRISKGSRIAVWPLLRSSRLRFYSHFHR
jgi:hypothetical protein